jgi:hypothetical protein
MNTNNFKLNGAGSTATETVLDRTATEVATVATIAKKIKRRVTYKVDSDRVGVTEKTAESPKSACDRPRALRRSSVARLPANKKTPRRVSKSASRGTRSQRYGSMKSPWWLDDNVQTYMELIVARELQEKLRKRSRTTKRTRPIDRTSEKHDLGVQPKDRHKRLKRKAKLTTGQRSGKSVNRRNRAR